MAVIPRHIYRRVEAALHRRGTGLDEAVKRYAALELKATGIAGGFGGQPQGGEVSDRVGRMAAELADAAAKLDEARRWERIYLCLDRHFAGRDEARAARLLYRQHLTQNQVAQAMYVERQTVRRWRDSIVCYAALMAIEDGLIRMGDDKDAQDDQDPHRRDL